MSMSTIFLSLFEREVFYITLCYTVDGLLSQV